MLCLSRTVNTSVIINHEIVVTVVEVNGGKVRLAFTAPDGIEINRLEIEAEKHGIPKKFERFLNAKDSTRGESEGERPKRNTRKKRTE